MLMGFKKGRESNEMICVVVDQVKPPPVRLASHTGRRPGPADALDLAPC